MNQKKSYKIHYTNSKSIGPDNSLDATKNIYRKRIRKPIIDRLQLTNQKNISSRDTQKSVSTIKQRLERIINLKNVGLVLNINNKMHVYHEIYYSKKDINCIIKTSNSVDHHQPKKDYENLIPKRHMSTNTKNGLRENKLFHQRCMTATNIKKVSSNFNIKNNEKNSIKKDLRASNIFRKFKAQPKMPFKRPELNKPKNEQKQSKKEKIENIKKNVKKIKYDLKSINGIESKQERIRNLLFGISYMTEKKECELCHKIVDRHTYKFHFHSHPSQILNWMFLGTFKNANNLEELKILRIKYILNCAIEIKPRNLPNYIKYFHLNLTDSPTTDITKFFEQAFSFIELARKKKEKILIHCKLGISRSPTILIAYFIKNMGHTTMSALEFLKSKRSQVHPNPGFITQLNSYERNIKKFQRNYLSPSITNSTADFSISKL